MNGLRNSFVNFLIDAVLIAILGVVMLIWPGGALNVVCILIGILLIALSLVKVILHFLNPEEGKLSFALLAGLIEASLGFALILHPEFFIGIFQIVTGVALIYGSVVAVWEGFKQLKVKLVLSILLWIAAALTAALGIIILINPLAWAQFMVRIQGVVLIGLGVAGIIFLLRMLKK